MQENELALEHTSMRSNSEFLAITGAYIGHMPLLETE